MVELVCVFCMLTLVTSSVDLGLCDHVYCSSCVDTYGILLESTDILVDGVVGVRCPGCRAFSRYDILTSNLERKREDFAECVYVGSNLSCCFFFSSFIYVYMYTCCCVYVCYVQAVKNSSTHGKRTVATTIVTDDGYGDFDVSGDSSVRQWTRILPITHARINVYSRYHYVSLSHTCTCAHFVYYVFIQLCSRIYTHTNVHAPAHTHTHAHTLTRIHIYLPTHTHTHIHTNTYAHIQSYVHTYIRNYIRIYTYVHMHMRTPTRSCCLALCVCVCVCLCLCV
jgi:hypothetical protein